MKSQLKLLAAVLSVALIGGCADSSSGSSGESSTALIEYKSEAESVSPNSPDETISENDVETVKKTYSDEDRAVYDAKIIDIDRNGTNELLVLTQQANPKVLEVWEKKDGKMSSVCSF